MDPPLSQPHAVATAIIAGTFSALFVAGDNGWSFHQWHWRPASQPQPPPIAAEHLTMRFPTFVEALAFFRERYALTVDGDGRGTP